MTVYKTDSCQTQAKATELKINKDVHYDSAPLLSKILFIMMY